MANEHRAANRSNAQRSTGPRSSDGKRRASQNAFRHGFASSVRTINSDKIEQLARQICAVSSASDQMALARVAAATQVICENVRATQIAVIQRVLVFGELEAQNPYIPNSGVSDYLLACIALGTLPGPPNAAEDMPSTEPERSTEAIMRAFRELYRLERYERRAVAQRNRAIGLLLSRAALADLPS